MTNLDPSLPVVIALHQRLLAAKTIAELSFGMVNDTWQLIPYRQASAYFKDALGRYRLKNVTGMVTVEEVTPFSLWLDHLSQGFCLRHPENQPVRMLREQVPQDFHKNWDEWWPEHAVFVPFHDRDGERRGYCVVVRDTPWEDADLQLLALQAQTWGYCAQALQKRSPISWVGGMFRSRAYRAAALAAVVVLSLVPVRISALAQAEIIALTSEAVTAPLDGVVSEFFVPPNTPVTKGQPLFALDDRTLQNRKQVALQALAVARADAHSAQQQAFSVEKQKAELATLLGKVRAKEIEVAYIDDLLTRNTVVAALDGIFIYSDQNDWLGKPVVTGERIAELAQPDDLGVLMWLPVGDAINLEPGAELRVFLQVSPLNALTAELTQTSYSAVVSPDGVAAYRLRGKLTQADDNVRIGLRGIAKVYGARYPLIYWVMRRPLGSIRQWLGL